MLQEFAVLGLDNFGYRVAVELHRLGHPVLVVDRDPGKIYTIRHQVTHAVEADLSHRDVLAELGVQDMDTVLISLGSSFQTALLLTYTLKELGVKSLAVKADGERRCQILTLAGADKIIQPESDLAVQTANFMHYARMVDYMELGNSLEADSRPELCHSQDLVAIRPPRSWLNRSFANLNCEATYGVHVVALLEAESGRWQPVYDRATVLLPSNLLLVLGERHNLIKLQDVE